LESSTGMFLGYVILGTKAKKLGNSRYTFSFFVIFIYLLGNMWSQTWENIGDFSRPFPNKPALNITPALTEQVRSDEIMLLFCIYIPLP